jgi:hypothetical protein
MFSTDRNKFSSSKVTTYLQQRDALGIEDYRWKESITIRVTSAAMALELPDACSSASGSLWCYMLLSPN